jgi:ribokinase
MMTLQRKNARCHLELFFFFFVSTMISNVGANILIVGSANADTFLPIARLPTEGENLTLLPGKQPAVDLPGGKGCTQAVATSKLLTTRQTTTCSFVGQFGTDDAALVLLKALNDAGVDTSNCGRHRDLPTGRGYVFLTQSGSVSAVVSGGSNLGGWKRWDQDSDEALSEEEIDQLLDNVSCVLLQREVPEHVNLLIAARAREKGNITVIQDAGGEDRPISSEMLQYCDYLIPNESELIRLIKSFGDDSLSPSNDYISHAKYLQQQGARNVLVTRGSKGSTLVTDDGKTIHQPSFLLAPHQVLDETGAGDCYRAAFAVALLEGRNLQQCMEFASAAGSLSVQVNGVSIHTVAVPFGNSI